MKKNNISKKEIWGLLLIAFLNIHSLLAQNNISFAPKLSIPTSPEAALLGRFGDVPVGYNTGTASISIPIYAISESGLQIPITLDYHSSGIKVSDDATWVGLGWNLSPEGTIIQEVRGKRDKFDDNLNQELNQAAYTTFKNRLNSMAMGNYKAILQEGYAYYNHCSSSGNPNFPGDAETILTSLIFGSGEPDIYTYNFGGYSGKFYINPETDQIILIDKKTDIVFQNIGYSSFIAYTPDGNKYNFNVLETASGVASSGSDEYSGFTYKLSSIELTNGKTVNFSYIDAQLTSRVYSQSTTMNFVCEPGYSSADLPSATITYSDIKILSRITTDDAIIDFNLENREDLIFNMSSDFKPKRLKSIDIKSAITGKKVKSFEFGYTYFPYTVQNNPDAKRLKLDYLKEVGYIDNEVADYSKPAHIFEYDLSVTLPLKTSFAVDFWGYYNGKDFNTGLLPDLDYFDYTYDNEYRDYSALPGRYPFHYNYTKSNRYTNNSKASAYMLKKIVYPTGGYTEFEYEPNEFTNQFIPNQSLINSVPNSINTVYKTNQLIDNNTTQPDQAPLDYYPFSKTFKLSKSAIINFSNTIYDGTGGPAGAAGVYSRGYIDGCYIRLKKTKNGVTTILKDWNTIDMLNVDYELNHGKSWNEDVRVEYDSDPSVEYTVSVYFPGNVNTKPADLYHAAAVRSYFTYFDDTDVNTSTSKQCGVRIKTVKSYANNGNVVSNKIIKYSNPDGTSSGKLLNRFRPLSSIMSFCNTCGPNNGGQTTSTSISFRQVLLSADDFGTGGGNLIGYGRVEEIELAENGIDNKGKKVFHYTSSENSTKKGFPNIQNILNGQLNKEEYFDSAGNLLYEKIYHYQNLSSPLSFDGIRLVNHSFGQADLGDGYPSATYGDPYKYSYETYPINSYWYVTQKTVVNEYYNGNLVTQTENNTYNQSGFLRSIWKINSNNETVTKKYFYAGEFSNPDSIETIMMNAKMNGIPLVTEDYLNNELLSRQKTEFAKDIATNNLILPKYIYAKKGDVSGIILEKKVTHDLYDNKGNLLQYTLESGIPVSIIWGYEKTLPVAKIENKLYSEISTALLGPIWTASQQNGTELELLSKLGDLRNSSQLQGAMVTTFTYKPLTGISTITDPKGDKMTYEYDAFGRLKAARDKDNNILSENEYHYRP